MEKRSDHLQWCKQRANEYMEQNDLQQAFVSFQSDMAKHPETEDNIGLRAGMTLLFSGQLSSKQEMKEWIERFN